VSAGEGEAVAGGDEEGSRGRSREERAELGGGGGVVEEEESVFVMESGLPEAGEGVEVVRASGVGAEEGIEEGDEGGGRGEGVGVGALEV